MASFQFLCAYSAVRSRVTYSPNNNRAMSAVGGKLSVGAEGACPEINGAYTGAISTSMLKSIGVQWVLAGHSERREIYGETDDYINAQCLQIVKEGMGVMLCIGEKIEEFEQDLAGSVCAVQLKKGLKGIAKDDLDKVVIAYEPVWAIGELSFLMTSFQFLCVYSAVRSQVTLFTEQQQGLGRLPLLKLRKQCIPNVARS